MGDAGKGTPGRPDRSAGLSSGDKRKLRGPQTEVKSRVLLPPGVFSSYRVLVVGGQELHQATLSPGVDPGSPEVGDLLGRWSGRRYVQPGPDGTDLLLVRRVLPVPGERTWLHVLLFLLTAATTTLAGAFLSPADPLRLRMAGEGYWAVPLPADVSLAAVAHGLWFSVPLLGVLAAHELGHYLYARRHGMDASLPYFIPAPYLVSLIGTFGAFIRLRSPLLTRGSLLEMAAAGPVASFVLSIPVLALGLAMSPAVALPPQLSEASGLFLGIGGAPQFAFGESLVVAAIRRVSAADGPLMMHPMAVAGWVGFFFTALNLFPVSQLDGGHVVYALSARWHRTAGFATLGMLLALGMRAETWLVWAVVVLVIGRGRLGHPPVVDARFRLGRGQTMIAWACLAIFALTLVPVPFP
jgi:Zn-dependent protease